jgi:hypothetical protein
MYEAPERPEGMEPLPVPCFDETPTTAGYRLVLLPARFAEHDAPTELVRTIVHACRHAYQAEVVDNLHQDRRIRIWRNAWAAVGPFDGPCPPSTSPLERDAQLFLEHVSAGYTNETGRQLTVAEARCLSTVQSGE